MELLLLPNGATAPVPGLGCDVSAGAPERVAPELLLTRLARLPVLPLPLRLVGVEVGGRPEEAPPPEKGIKE